jgi:hypothetical protein
MSTRSPEHEAHNSFAASFEVENSTGRDAEIFLFTTASSCPPPLILLSNTYSYGWRGRGEDDLATLSLVLRLRMFMYFASLIHHHDLLIMSMYIYGVSHESRAIAELLLFGKK